MNPKPLKIAIVGCGGIVRMHVPVFKEFPGHVRIAGVCDINESAAQSLAARLETKNVFKDIDQMLSDCDCDAVDIITTHDTHCELALAAIRAGKHVLIEKPMATTMGQCRQMVDEADKAGVTLMVAQCQRYDPSYRAVRNAIVSGELGAIRAVRFDSMQNQLAVLPEAHWLTDGRRAGGGVVISVSVHRIDLMRYLVGEIKRVTAICRSTSGKYSHGAEDYAAALLEFENGAVGEMFATCVGFRMPWGEQFMIFGDDGVIHAVPEIGQYMGSAMIASRKRLDDSTEWNESYSGFTALEPTTAGHPTSDQFTNEILHFVQCCRDGAEPLSSGRDNLGTMKTIFAIYRSAQEGQSILLNDVM